MENILYNIGCMLPSGSIKLNFIKGCYAPAMPLPTKPGWGGSQSGQVPRGKGTARSSADLYRICHLYLSCTWNPNIRTRALGGEPEWSGPQRQGHCLSPSLKLSLKLRAVEEVINCHLLNVRLFSAGGSCSGNKICCNGRCVPRRGRPAVPACRRNN